MRMQPDTHHVSLISGFLRVAPQAANGGSPVQPYPLDPARVAEFNAIIQAVAPGAPAVDAGLIAQMARQLLGDTSTEGTQSVQRRLDHAGRLQSMAADEAWRLPASDAERVDTVMTYLTRADDLIPDHVPVVGLMDDAMLIELAQRALEREIDDYTDFCRFRDAEAKARGVDLGEIGIERRDWLAWRRVLAQRHGQPVGRRFGGDQASGPAFRVR